MSVFAKKTYEEQEWISLADLMSGLMLLFLAIAVFFMVSLGRGFEDVQTGETNLRDSLNAAMTPEILAAWVADFNDSTFTVTFLDQDLLFESGSAELQEAFKETLRSFFPIWLGPLIRNEQHGDLIRELSIEGHTSSYWEGLEGVEAYLQNMALSQARALSVLNYVVDLPVSQENWDPWLRERITASGLSSSKIKLTDEGFEDSGQSRRVEFRMITNAEERLRQLFGDDGEFVIGRRNDTQGPR